MRVGLFQMACEKGALAQNLEQTQQYLAQAATRQVDIAAFPEASLSGYIDPARYPHAVLRLDGPDVAQFLTATRPYDFTVLAGVIEENPQGKPFVTQLVARAGTLVGVMRKRRNIEQDALFYACGEDIPVFHHDSVTFGISICADMGDALVFSECARQGAQVMFELAAPGLYGEQSQRNWRSGFEWWEGECQRCLSAYARQHHAWMLAATQAGRTVDEDFPGGGYVFNPRGERLIATPDETPGALFVELDLVGGSAQRC